MKKLISISDAREGEKLAKDVFNDRSQLLVPRETVLDARSLKRLIQAGIDEVFIYGEESDNPGEVDAPADVPGSG